MHTDAVARSGEWVARMFVVDAEGKKVYGDAGSITSRWQDLLLDLKTAADEGADVSRIVTVGIAFQNVRAGGSALEVQTDTWTLAREYRAYEGERLGREKSFYVEREGMRLRVGTVGGYEVTFHQRSGADRPWISITGPKSALLMGQKGTGLMLLDQTGFDSIGGAIRQDGFDAHAPSGGVLPSFSWPIRDEKSDVSTWRWECVWTSAVGAIVEVKQEVGPYDRLGEPAGRVTWRFMMYQWGQVFVHAEWGKVGGEGELARPISWALVLDEAAQAGSDSRSLQARSGEVSGKDAERLLGAIYPVSVKEGLKTALPHRMQAGAGVAMIAKLPGAGTRNTWWWTRGDGKRLFGCGLSTAPGLTGADCMLLVNNPDPLMQASSFGAYLVPPKVKVRQGELDRNFPGDIDNDGFVDSYGFQVVRLSNGRASFTVYPQERPLFYPAYLFTVPAVEREAVDLAHSRVLINLDGKQFSDPPRFPDGSFLLQLPYVIDRPVAVEAILVKR